MSQGLKHINKKNAIALAIALVFILVGVFYIRYVEPPRTFPTGSVVSVEEGDSLSKISIRLKEEGVVKSSQWLSNFIILLRGEAGVIAGDYYFESPESSFRIAKRLTAGSYGLDSIRVTIPEGFSVEEMASVFEARLPLFEAEKFLELTVDKEGYLFPDTYFFQPTVREEEVIRRMEKEFEDNLSLIRADLDQFGRPLEDVIIMASILEEEAVTTNDRRIVSGLLWERIRIGMPLQVDATFLKVNGKSTYELTRDDLATDSPYNTYLYRGLPPAPISSPGLDSILAAVKPIETPFLYYLSEEDGTIHYAEDLEEHNRNKILYIP